MNQTTEHSGFTDVDAQRTVKPRRLVISCVTCALSICTFVAAACWAQGRVFVNVTGSMPIGLYRRLEGAPSRGDIVVACLPEAVARLALARKYVWRGQCPGEAAPIGKTVVAIAGDTVSMSVDGTSINGRLIPGSQPVARDSRGREMGHIAAGERVVETGQLWLMSTHNPLSFDSRYFGAIQASGVLARVQPLLMSGRFRESRSPSATEH
jgi:conjugative transfer signal peptidase TraF